MFGKTRNWRYLHSEQRWKHRSRDRGKSAFSVGEVIESKRRDSVSVVAARRGIGCQMCSFNTGIGCAVRNPDPGLAVADRAAHHQAWAYLVINATGKTAAGRRGASRANDRIAAVFPI